MLLWFYYNWEGERLAPNVSEHQVPIGDKKKRGRRVGERMSGRGNAQNWMCATGLYKTRRRKEQDTERERESMSSVRNGRKGACYTSTCISSSSTNVPVRVCMRARELETEREREEVKYAFRQLILTHNFYFTKWAYSVHWRRHSEGGEREYRKGWNVYLCVCVGKCSGGCTIWKVQK